jgi:hypothetical protein
MFEALIEGWEIYIAAVFENGKFEKFECDSSFEEFSGGSFVVEIFLVFSSENIKDLSASVTLYKIVALTNLIIWFIIASDKVNN